MCTIKQFVSLFAFVSVHLLATACGAQEPEQNNSSKVLDLLKERRDTLKEVVEFLIEQERTGFRMVATERMYRAEIAVLDAELELPTTHAERIKLHERRVEIFVGLEEYLGKRAGVLGIKPDVSADMVLEVKAERLAAQIALQREIEKEKKAKP